MKKLLKRLLPNPVSDRVEHQQVRLLFSQGVAIQSLGMLTALICVMILWSVANQTLLSLWLILMVFFSTIRMVMTKRFLRLNIEDSELRRWENRYIIGTLLSGMIWGALAFFYSSEWPLPYQIILYVVYTGLVAGAFNTNISVFYAFPAFYLPPILSLMWVTLSQQQDGNAALGTLYVIYIILMYVSALKLNRRIAISLQTSIDNELLAQELSESNRKLKRAKEAEESANHHKDSFWLR